jgi:hypothetical protein
MGGKRNRTQSMNEKKRGQEEHRENKTSEDQGVLLIYERKELLLMF